MATEYWQLYFDGTEGGASGEITFPNDWNDSTDLFYLRELWIDGLSFTDTAVQITLAVSAFPEPLDGSIAYKFNYTGSQQVKFVNPWVMSRGMAYFSLLGSTEDVRITLVGDRKSSASNPDLALVAFDKAIYENNPIV